jgi:hypothetical protein
VRLPIASFTVRDGFNRRREFWSATDAGAHPRKGEPDIDYDDAADILVTYDVFQRSSGGGSEALDILRRRGFPLQRGLVWVGELRAAPWLPNPGERESQQNPNSETGVRKPTRIQSRRPWFLGVSSLRVPSHITCCRSQ